MGTWNSGTRPPEPEPEAPEPKAKAPRIVAEAKQHVHEWTQISPTKRKCKPCGAIERDE